MPATVAAFVVVAAVPSDQGFMTLKPMPLPIASRISERPADTAAPARMADQDTAELGAGSFSTMTVSTIGDVPPFSHRTNGELRQALPRSCEKPPTDCWP